VSARPVAANPRVHTLAEGPFWDAESERLLWVDIVAGVVLSGALAADGSIAITDERSVGDTAAAVAPASDGTLLVATADRLVELASDGSVSEVVRLLDHGGRRLNDGHPDPAGRYLVGTLSREAPSETEQLFSVDLDGSVRVLDDDLTLSNGLAWSRDGSRMFSVDTLRQRVHVRDYDIATGHTGAREVFAELADGYPDGICLDAEDHLWVAVWGRGEVHRYTPAGVRERVVVIPAPHTTSVAFAGADLDVLVVTTATQALGADQLAAFPHSGKLFTLTPGVAGLPQPHWRGPTPRRMP
jgi:sugar lactone lactonase YvrE